MDVFEGRGRACVRVWLFSWEIREARWVVKAREEVEEEVEEEGFGVCLGFEDILLVLEEVGVFLEC